MAMNDRLYDECHGYDIDGNPVMRVRTYDVGQDGTETLTGTCDLSEALERDDPEYAAALAALQAGGSYRVGGGAAPLVVLRREAERQFPHFFCPECGSARIVYDVAVWNARSTEPHDTDNTADLTEYQCADCSRSIWL
jgi:DNA-directed RNA polymerase subunit RPC12/RpoP